MKKSILATVLIICMTFLATAQGKHKKHKKPEFTVEQETTLAVKKLTLALDLSTAQQAKMHPLMKEAISKKKEAMEARKANKGKAPLTNDEIYAKMIQKLDYQIAFQEKVKKILKSDQYEKWHRMKSKMHKDSQKKAAMKGHQKKGTPKGNRANS